MKKVLVLLTILFLSTAVLTGCGNKQEDSITETNNQSVYKTIDFNSYTGDSKSTEFNDLVNKKVTFTNVPTLGGTLGNMVKGFMCDNENTLTIEDDVKYTLTGIVTRTTGTYMVSMKDCTLTKQQ